MKKTFFFLLCVAIGTLSSFGQSRLSDWHSLASKSSVCRIVHDDNFVYASSFSGGLTKIDKKTGQQQSLNRGNRLCHDNTILDMTIHNGELYLTGRMYGISKIANGHYTRLNLDFETEQWIQGIHIIDNKTMLLGGLMEFHKIENGKTTYSYGLNALSPMAYITDIKKTDNGQIYVSSYDWNLSESFFKFDGNELIRINHFYRNIYKMCPQGNTLWLATERDGLVKYENDTFRQYSTASSSIPSDYLTDICEGTDGKIWIASLTHLICFHNEKFTSFTLPEEYGPDYINAVDADGETIYVGTQNNGLFKFDGQTFEKIELIDNSLPYNSFNFQLNPSAGTSAIRADGTLLVTGANGLITYDPTKGVSGHKPYVGLRDVYVSPTTDDVWMLIHDVDRPDETQLIRLRGDEQTTIPQSETQVWQLFGFDNRDRLWGRTINGLANFDGTDWNTYDQNDAGFDIRRVSCMKFDSRGRLWAGSFGNGLIMFDGTEWKNFTRANSDIPSDYVGSIGIDNDDIIWLNGRDEFHPHADCDGTGLTRFDGSTWKTYTTLNSPIPSNNIYSIEVDADNVKWLATCGNTALTSFDNQKWEFYTVDNSGIADNMPFNISIDRNGNRIWIIHYEYGISYATINGSGSALTSPEAFPIDGPTVIFNLQGRKILEIDGAAELPLTLPSGIYIISSPRGSKKLKVA